MCQHAGIGWKQRRSRDELCGALRPNGCRNKVPPGSGRSERTPRHGEQGLLRLFESPLNPLGDGFAHRVFAREFNGERGVHRVPLGPRRRDEEPSGVPERSCPLKHHFQPPRRVVAHLVTKQPPDRLGLQPRLRSRPPGVERHPIEGEPGQGRLAHPFLDRPAGFEGRRQPIPHEVPQFVLGRRHPHGRSRVFGDRPAGAVHHRLGLGTLRRALLRPSSEASTSYSAANSSGRPTKRLRPQELRCPPRYARKHESIDRKPENVVPRPRRVFVSHWLSKVLEVKL
jgi:hypothetical protein